MYLTRRKILYCFGMVFVSVACLPEALAQLEIKLNEGSNKWGYKAEHVTACLPLKSKNIEFRARFKLPCRASKIFLPHESWFGVYLEDAVHRHRYTLGLINPSHDNTPRKLPFAAICYKNKGTYKVSKSETLFDTTDKSLFLKVTLRNDELELASSKDGVNYTGRLKLTPPDNFSPTQIGISLDSYHKRTSIDRLIIDKITLKKEGGENVKIALDAGSNPPFIFNKKRAEFWFPVRMQLKWIANDKSSDVFDTGTQAELGFSLRTSSLAGKSANVIISCRNYSGQEVFHEVRTLKLEPEITGKIVIPAEKLKRNGTYPLSLEVVVDGVREGIMQQQFAVIPPRRVTPGKFDITSPYSTNYFSDWRLAARIGVKKLRQTYRSAKDFEQKKFAADAWQNGLMINGPYLQASIRSEKPDKVAKKAKDIASMFIMLKKKYPDIIYCQEVYNEPENWPPSSLNTDLVPFVGLVCQIGAELRVAQAPVKLMGTGTTHCNLSFLKKVATIGTPDAVDIVAIHGYRSPNRPEFGHEEDIAAIRSLYGPEKPIYINEDAYFANSDEIKGEEAASITKPFHSMIELDELTQGVYVQRKFLCQLAAGFSLVNQFDSAKNHSFNPSRFHRRPGLVTYAALTSILAHPKMQRRRTAMTDHLWMIDWMSDGKPVTTLWALNGFHEVNLTAPVKIIVKDCFDNPVAEGREVRIVVGGAPLFVTGALPELKSRRVVNIADVRPAVVLPEEVENFDKPIFAMVGGYAKSMDESVVSVTVKNNSDKEFSGTISPVFMNNAPDEWYFKPDKTAFSLKPGALLKFDFIPQSKSKAKPFDPYNPVPGEGYAALWWTEGFRVAAKISSSQSNWNRLFSPRKPLCLRGIPRRDDVVIDGSLSDWQGVPDFKPFGRKKRNVGLSRFWTGKADFFPTFKFAWNLRGLLFMAEVLDDKLDATEKGLDAWRTDSIQLGINSRLQMPDFTDYQVITLAIGNPAILQRATRKLKAGPLSSVKLKVVRVEGDGENLGRTLYECLIPWQLIDIEPKSGTTFGFSSLFNESDGWWRKGWEGYFMPMGGHIVDPRFFGDLTLVEK